ncbi:MAG TPA: GntR family transcriptional regulator [Burkholderiaceae bacterium]|nr:GntR family transcriptional regulator [Burkholderiaceae bacterium]
MDRQPLYARIADRLAQDIASGRYAVGTVLPKEPDLAAQLQVSRATLRAALSSLERRKLVSRRKNAGTRVESDRPLASYGAQLSTLPDLVQWARQCARAVQASRAVELDAAQARELGCPIGSRWLLVQSLRLDAASGEAPVSWTDAYVAEPYAAVLDAIEREPSRLISDLLEQNFALDVATVEQEVLGWKLGTVHARALDAQPGEAALKVVRRYLARGGEPVLATVSIHPAARFSIKTTLSRH